MYMLIRINPSEFHDIENDKDFFTKLICEESISCLPASVKHYFLKISNQCIFFSSRCLVLIIFFVLYSQHQRIKLKKHVNAWSNFVDDMQNLFPKKFIGCSFFLILQIKDNKNIIRAVINIQVNI